MFMYPNQSQSEGIADTNATFSDDELQLDALTTTTSSNRYPTTTPYKSQSFQESNKVADDTKEEDSDESDDFPSFKFGSHNNEESKKTNMESGGFNFNDGMSDNGSTASPTHSYINDEAELKEKRLMLQKIRRYELRKGIKPEKALSLHSSLDEIKEELDMIRKECQLETSVDKMKQGLVFMTWGIETLNNKYDPLDLYLDGWSASIDENIDSYEEILEKIYDLYYDQIDMHPLVELIMALGFSAVVHHSTRSGKAMKMFEGPKPEVPERRPEVQGPSGDIAEKILKEDIETLKLSKK